MGNHYTKADLAAAWESGYWHGTSHNGPLNNAEDRATRSMSTHGGQQEVTVISESGLYVAVFGSKVALKTEKGRDTSPKSVTASEPTNH